MKKGKIILLNGVSSAGKSTLGLALQDTLEDKFFLFSQDGFSETWPYKYWRDDPDGVYTETMLYMNRTIEMLAGTGVNIIIDHLFLDNGADDATGPTVLHDCVRRFSGLPVWFVRVDCAPDELDRRERWRGDRSLGSALRQLNELYPRRTCDIAVDTSKKHIIECAREITQAVQTHASGAAFAEMKTRLDAGLRIE